MAKFQPMLAETCDDIRTLAYPGVVTPKLDGIRALVVDGVLVSRNLKPIRNAHVQRLFGRPELNGLDGELIVGSAHGPGVFDRTSSGVMSADGEPRVKYHVFDAHGVFAGYKARRAEALNAAMRSELFPAQINVLPQCFVSSPEELEAYEAEHVALGYEGVMFRSLAGTAARATYKFGRSTARECLLMKVIRKRTLEALITGTIEQLHNANELTTDARGYAKRAKLSEHLIPNGKLGALECAPLGVDGGKPFEVGTGFTDEQRRDFWQRRETLIGRLITVEYRELTKDGAPRFPVFKGFRSLADMDHKPRGFW